MGEQHQQDQIICQKFSVHQLGLQQIWVFRIKTIIKAKVTISRIHATEGQKLRQFLHFLIFQGHRVRTYPRSETAAVKTLRRVGPHLGVELFYSFE